MKYFLPQEWESFKEKLFFDHLELEKEVDEGTDLYKNLHYHALYTSFEDLKSIFECSWCQGTWVDLGTGVGQSALLYGMLFPDRKAIGIEKSFSRIRKGAELKNKLNLVNVSLICADLINTSIPKGDTFFLYFPTGPVLDRVLDELQDIQFHSLIAIESHGDLLPRLRKVSWLLEKGRIPLKSERHFSEAVVFGKKFSPKIVGPHQLSFIERILYIEDKNGFIWAGESLGLEWIGGESYQLKNPPRTIQWGQVKKDSSLQELPEAVIFLVKLRRLGEMKINTKSNEIRGVIRKIFISPRLMLEISTGEQLEWSDVIKITSGDQLCYDILSGHFFLPHVL